MNLPYTLRCATRADESSLRMLIEESVRGLSTNDYTSTQISAALQSAWALRQGFRRLELLATIPGHRLYKAFGYEGDKRQSFVLAGGIPIDFIPMAKQFASESLGRDDL